MNTERELEILFPTSFSDSCFRMIPAVAQFVDTLRVRMTLLHVYNSNRTTRTDAENKIESFFAEAHHYGSCRRIATNGNPVEVIRQFCRQEKVDLIMAPSSDRIGLPRLNHRSFRAQLLSTVSAPLWTLDPSAERRNFSQRIRNVACWVDFECPNTTHLRNAAEFARRLNAKLHIVHAVPNIHEGVLARVLTSDKPLHPSVAIRRIEALTSWMSSPPEMHVSIGDNAHEIPRLLESFAADVVFLGEGQALRYRLRRPAMGRLAGHLPCPAVCFDGASGEGVEWALDARSAEVSHVAASLESGLVAA